MPKKAKRYRVFFHEPIMNTWLPLATHLTSADATKLIGMVMYDCKKEEVEDDSE